MTSDLLNSVRTRRARGRVIRIKQGTIRAWREVDPDEMSVAIAYDDVDARVILVLTPEQAAELGCELQDLVDGEPPRCGCCEQYLTPETSHDDVMCRACHRGHHATATHQVAP